MFGFNEHEIPRAEAMAVDIGVEKLIFLPAFLDEGRYPMPESDKSLVATWKPKNPLYQIENASGNDATPRSRCGWHYMSAAVNWDGTVASCCTTFSKQDDFGTIGPSGESSFMGSSIMRPFAASASGLRAGGKSVSTWCAKSAQRQPSWTITSF